MKIPFGSIPKDNILPEGNWTLEIEQGESGVSKNGFKQIMIPFRTLAPIQGLVHYERFVIGTPEDKDAEDPQTWVNSFAARRMSTILAKAQVPVTDDMEEEEMLAAAVGCRFDAAVIHKVDDGAKNPEYKGSIRVQIRPYEEGVLQKQVGGQEAVRRPAPAAPQQKAAPRPNGGNGQARLARPVPQAAPPAVEEYEEPEVEDVQPRRPQQRTPTPR